ncbi:hypothetical protein SMIPMB4A_v3c4590 [Spiroplasma melliferum IPMB4A]|nr:hypothetical protein [Spiroplasma melliferum]ELL44570.1 hypothetical protein SMIPMB4A_v3c4590 [Spiroplasma melliferum IPMB4A]
MLIGFVMLLGYFPISLYYDGYLTILKTNDDELTYIFVPHQTPGVIKPGQQVKIKYFVEKQWQIIITQVKRENDYYLILNQPEFIISVWYLSAKMEFGSQTTLDYLLKIMI